MWEGPHIGLHLMLWVHMHYWTGFYLIFFLKSEKLSNFLIYLIEQLQESQLFFPRQIETCSIILFVLDFFFSKTLERYNFCGESSIGINQRMDSLQLQFSCGSSECYRPSITKEEQSKSHKYESSICNRNSQSQLHSSHKGAREELAQLYSRGIIEMVSFWNMPAV